MELMIKMSAAEADEAMAKGLIQALVYPFSCREEVRKAAEKTAEKAEEVKTEEVKTEEPKVQQVEQKPAEAEKPKEPAETKQETPKAEQEPVEAEQTYTLDQLSKAAADLITNDASSQTKLLELLHKFGIESMPELKPEDYTRFGEELKAVGGNL